MCGRYDIIDVDERLVSHFGLSVKPQGYRPRYNAAPSQKLPVITNDEPDQLSFLSWGLTPPWAPKPGQKVLNPINARAETVATSPMFRHAFTKRRCLSLMAPIHNRMPVILHEDEYDRWLEGSDQADAAALLVPYPASELEAYPVSTLVNAPRNDMPAVIEPHTPTP